MKKITVAFLCLLMASGTILYANGRDEGSSSAMASFNETGLPIVNETATITVMNRTRPGSVDDYENNAFTIWLEEQTNVHVDFVLSPESDYKKKINLTMASGDYPDVIMRTAFSLAEQNLYYEQGILQDLAPFVDKYGVETKKMFAEYPAVEKKLTLPGGAMVSLPRIADQYHLQMCQKMWIYKPWLDKLGLEVPTTTEELENVLIAFRDKDPNGNGKSDEIPLTACIGIKDIQVDGFLMNAFIYNPYDSKTANWRLIMQDGKVDVPYNKEAYRDGMVYLNNLYAQGLIVPDTFVQDKATMKQLGENPDYPLLGSVIARFPSHFTQINGESGRWKEYVSVPALMGPDGNRVARYTPYYVGEAAFNMTVACEQPEITMRWADRFFDLETGLRAYKGELGVDWRWAEDGEIGINGKPAVYKMLQDTAINAGWGQGHHFMESADVASGEAYDPSNITLSKILYDETARNYEPYKASMDLIVPPILLGTDISSELVDVETTLNDYVTNMAVKFITGMVDLDRGWDNYLKELDKIGIDRYLAIYNEAYDNQYR